MNLKKVFKYLKDERTEVNPIGIDDINEDYVLIGNRFLFFRVDRKDWKRQIRKYKDVKYVYSDLYAHKSTKSLKLDEETEERYIFKRVDTGNEVLANKDFFQVFDMNNVEFRQDKNNELGLIEVVENEVVVAMICPMRS